MENSCFVKLWYLKLILQHQRSEIPTRTHGQTEGERESLDNVKINQDDFSRPTEERKNEKIQISFFVSKNEFSSKKGIRNNVKSVIKSKIFFHVRKCFYCVVSRHWIYNGGFLSHSKTLPRNCWISQTQNQKHKMTNQCNIK